MILLNLFQNEVFGFIGMATIFASLLMGIYCIYAYFKFSPYEEMVPDFIPEKPDLKKDQITLLKLMKHQISDTSKLMLHMGWMNSHPIHEELIQITLRLNFLIDLIQLEDTKYGLSKNQWENAMIYLFYYLSPIPDKIPTQPFNRFRQYTIDGLDERREIQVIPKPYSGMEEGNSISERAEQWKAQMKEHHPYLTQLK